MFTPGWRGCGYKTVSGRHEWPNRDPIGELGGLNLYGYVGNDPIDYIDPYGLFNYVKGGVGVINIGRGIYKGVKGGLELAIGVPAMIVGPGTGPLAPLEEAGAGLVTAIGLADVTGASFLVKRGGKQLGEASGDPCKGHVRNLLGLLPFGALYDDPGESIGDALEKFENLPFWHKVGEIFTF
jgi:hypothetical protein